MMRDLDVARSILRKLEERDSFEPMTLTIPGVGQDVVEYHLHLLRDGGLIAGIVGKTTGNVVPERLTWSGHDFLDASRNEEAWEFAKKSAGKVGTVAFEVFKALLIQWAKQNVGLQ